MSWKEMIQVERGADITEMEAPIPSTIGEGFTFCLDLDGEKYTTIGDYTKGKRDVEFCITSYIGYCGGAEHYYCSISIPVVNRSGNKIVGGYLGGIKVPNDKLVKHRIIFQGLVNGKRKIKEQVMNFCSGECAMNEQCSREG